MIDLSNLRKRERWLMRLSLKDQNGSHILPSPLSEFYFASAIDLDRIRQAYLRRHRP